MYVVQDHGPGSNSAAVLKVGEGNATFICTINAAERQRGWGQPGAAVGEQLQDQNPAIAIGRILCIELERRDAMK